MSETRIHRDQRSSHDHIQPVDHQEPRPEATGTGRAFDGLCHRLAGPPARPHGGATSARQPRTASCKSPEIVHKPSPGAVTPGWVPGLTRSTSSTKPAPTRPALIPAKSGQSLYPLAITSRFYSSTTRRRFYHDTKSLSLVSLGPATSSGFFRFSKTVLAYHQIASIFKNYTQIILSGRNFIHILSRLKPSHTPQRYSFRTCPHPFLLNSFPRNDDAANKPML